VQNQEDFSTEQHPLRGNLNIEKANVVPAQRRDTPNKNTPIT